MQGNFIMLQKDDLKEAIAEVLEAMVGKNLLTGQKPKDDVEYLTRDELCARLHITYTTLWRMEKRGERFMCIRLDVATSIPRRRWMRSSRKAHP